MRPRKTWFTRTPKTSATGATKTASAVGADTNTAEVTKSLPEALRVTKEVYQKDWDYRLLELQQTQTTKDALVVKIKALNKILYGNENYSTKGNFWKNIIHFTLLIGIVGMEGPLNQMGMQSVTSVTLWAWVMAAGYAALVITSAEFGARLLKSGILNHRTSDKVISFILILSTVVSFAILAIWRNEYLQETQGITKSIPQQVGISWMLYLGGLVISYMFACKIADERAEKTLREMIKRLKPLDKKLAQQDKQMKGLKGDYTGRIVGAIHQTVENGVKNLQLAEQRLKDAKLEAEQEAQRLEKEKLTNEEEVAQTLDNEITPEQNNFENAVKLFENEATKLESKVAESASDESLKAGLPTDLNNLEDVFAEIGIPAARYANNGATSMKMTELRIRLSNLQNSIQNETAN